MSQEVKEFYEKFNNDMAKMKQQAPDMLTGFGALFSKVMKEGSITVLEKELVAVGIAVATQCCPCIRLHVKKCLGAGATREQIIEAASVAVMMAGGPAYTHIPEVIEALDAAEE